eukprot:SAG31_NODE_5311_length_2615_cov_20.215917_1_plen_91_part_00
MAVVTNAYARMSAVRRVKQHLLSIEQHKAIRRERFFFYPLEGFPIQIAKCHSIIFIRLKKFLKAVQKVTNRPQVRKVDLRRSIDELTGSH